MSIDLGSAWPDEAAGGSRLAVGVDAPEHPWGPLFPPPSGVRYTSLTIPPGLTASRAKAALYSVDPYFRDAWDDVEQVWGGDAATRLHEGALIVFKPEAVVSRKIEPALECLRDDGFVPVAAQTFVYDRHIIREAWPTSPTIGTSWIAPI